MNLIIYNTKNNIKNSLILNIITLITLISLFFITKNIYEKYILFIENLNDNNEIKEKVFLIKQKNKQDNLFLFKEIGSDNILKIVNIYKKYNPKIIKEYAIPTGVITRTSSYALTAYGIENLTVESTNYKYKELKENLLAGTMFEEGKNEIIIGSFAASNMNINTNEYVSFLRRNERGWLDNKVFLIKGIFSVDKYNDNIFSDSLSISNFIFSKEGGSAYSQNVYLVLTGKINNKKIISIFDKSDLNKEYEILNTQSDNDLRFMQITFQILFIIFVISSSLIIATLNNLQIAKRLSHGFVRENKIVSKRSLTLQIFFIAFIAILISYIFTLIQNINTEEKTILLYSSLSVIASSVVAVIITVLRKHIKENI